MEERPWSEYGRTRKPITQRQLAKILGAFNIVPITVQLPDATIAKGYDLEDLADAFSRYLHDLADLNRQTVKAIRAQGETASLPSVEPQPINGSESAASFYGDNALNGLTDEKCDTAPGGEDEKEVSWEI